MKDLTEEEDMISIFSHFAKKYIQKNASFLLNDHYLETSQFRELGDHLAQDRLAYLQYMSALGINKVCPVREKRIVQLAENDPISYVLRYSEINKDPEAYLHLDGCYEYLSAFYKFLEDSKAVYAVMAPAIPGWVKRSLEEDYITFAVCGLDPELLKPLTPIFTFFYANKRGLDDATYIVNLNPDMLRKLLQRIPMPESVEEDEETVL